jgi:hypothetical protein
VVSEGVFCGCRVTFTFTGGAVTLIGGALTFTGGALTFTGEETTTELLCALDDEGIEALPGLVTLDAEPVSDEGEVLALGGG